MPGEQPGTPVVVLDDLGEVPHGFRFRARQGKSLLLLTVLAPEVSMQRELRDLLSYRVVQAGEVAHPNLLPTYGCFSLPLPGDDAFATLVVVRPDPGCPTLRQWLHEVWRAGHALDPLNAVALAVQACEALSALHERCPHGYVTPDNVYMYPTGGMPQALLGGAGEGVLLPFAPGFEAFAEAGYLPMAGRELSEAPYEPRVETDVLGVAGLVLEILTGQPLTAGMPLEPFGLPPRLHKILAVASQPSADDRPKEISMFSRRLQAAVGLGEDPVEPSAVLEPVHHGEHADPRYPAVRARAWRPPPPPAPPWAREDPRHAGSGAWNVGTPVPGSGAWNVGAPTPGSGAWNVGAPTPGSGAWNTPGSGAWAQPGSGAWAQPGAGAWSPDEGSHARVPAPEAPPQPADEDDDHQQYAFEAVPVPAGPADAAPTVASSLTSLAALAPEPAPVAPSSVVRPMPEPAPEPPVAPPSAPPPPVDAASLAAPMPQPPAATPTSVSIAMPAPDGSVMSPVSRGPADFAVHRRGKVHGPYDLGQLERLIPLGKLRSVDAIEIVSRGERVLAVDLPGLRPLFEARAAEEDRSVMAPLPSPPPSASPPDTQLRGRLWLIIVALAALAVALAVFAMR